MPYPYIPARKHGGEQASIKRIVIHATVSPCVEGGARNVARYFQSQAAGGSAHYVVDPGEIVQCVKDDVVAHHAPPNTGTLGVELCDPQKGAAARWGDASHEAMLERAAVLVRALAAKHDVPLVRLSVADLRAGKRGICGHVEVSKAWEKTDHGDPELGGPFPWARFMAMIKGDGMDAKQVHDAVWKRDAIPAPDGSKTNPTWKAESVLVDTNQRVRTVKEQLDEIEAKVDQLLGLSTPS